MEIIGNLLLVNSRAFIQSANIDIFPCSRRGQYYNAEKQPKYYDPEARLNTERTNRISTAINGFKDSFIEGFVKDSDGNDTNTFVFVLAGYRIEVRNFNINSIAEVLETEQNSQNGDNTIYAHLSLHQGISLGVEDYYTEILYRQSTNSNEEQYLDVAYGDDGEHFFVGVSFTKNPEASDAGVKPYTLELFNFNNETGIWVLTQTSLLPKIDHDVLEDSVVLDELHVKQNLKVDADLTVGAPNIGDATKLTSGAIAAEQILVPYTGTIEGFPNTEVDKDGIETAYIRAGSIRANGLAIGNEITIVDDKDRDDDTNFDEALTTIGKGYVSAVDMLKVPGVFEATANDYTMDDFGKIVNTEEVNKVTILAANGLDVENQATFKGKTTINNALEVNVGGGQVVISADDGLKVAHAARFMDNITVDAAKTVTMSNLAVDTITSRTDDDEVLVKSSASFEKNLEIVDNDSALFEIVNDGTNSAATFNVPTTVNNSVTINDTEGNNLFNVTKDVTEIKVPTVTIDTNSSFTIKKGNEVSVTVTPAATTIESPTTIKNDFTLTTPSGTQVAKVQTTDAKVTINAPVEVNEKITAQNLEIDLADGTVDTPTLVVDTITTKNEDGLITINKAVEIDNSTLEVSGAVTLTAGLKVTGDTEIAGDTTTITGETTVNGGLVVKSIAGTVEDLVVEQAKATVNGSIIVNGSDGSVAGGEITANTINVNTITSADKTVRIDDTLVVDKINTQATVLTIMPDTAVQGSTKLFKDLTVTTSDEDFQNEKTSDIIVDRGNITVTDGTISTNNLNVSGVVTLGEDASLDTPNVTVSQALNVTKLPEDTDPAVATIDKAIITTSEIETLSVTGDTELASLKVGTSYYENVDASIAGTTATTDLRVENTALFNTLSATEISAKKITQNNNPVPAISLSENAGKWRLQITTDASAK